jgi:signal transduction histidine kinase
MRTCLIAASVPFVARAERLQARIRQLVPSKIDLLAAGLLAVLSAALLAGSRHPIPAVALGILGSASVATRRRAPVFSVLSIVAVSALIALIDHGAQEPAQGIATACCFYTLAGRPAARRNVDVALLVLVVGAVALTPQGGAVNVVVKWVLFVLLPYLAGRTVRSRRGLTRELEANAERVRREQEARARAATAEERTRIARELHDVIAHSLSVMVIQTVAAREVAADDRAAASAALGAVQLAGREALLEMRRLIGVLRHGDIELAGSAAPGLDQLDRLAQQARLSGLPVEVNMLGRRRRLPEALDLVAFRIVQEALTNSIKHAGPARASVTVTFAAEMLELEICDDGRGVTPDRAVDGGGHGLVGMRERLALFDGELSIGCRPGGGFRVYAQLPMEESLVP